MFVTFIPLLFPYIDPRIILIGFICNHKPLCRYSSTNNFDLHSDDITYVVDFNNDILKYKNFIYLQETKDEEFITGFVNKYYAHYNERDNLRLLILTHEDESVIIFGTEEALVILRRLKELFDFQWIADRRNYNWKQLKFRQETLSNINVNIEYPINVNYLTILNRIHIKYSVPIRSTYKPYIPPQFRRTPVLQLIENDDEEETDVE